MSVGSDYLLWVVLACVSFYIFGIIRKWLQWSGEIDKIPGPKGVPFLGVTWRFLISKREDVTKMMRAMTESFAKKYPLMRIWAGPIPLIILMNAESVKVLLNSNKHIEKAVFYHYLRNWIGDGLLTSTGSKWQHRRKLITPSFHFRILENFLLVMNEQADILIKVLQKKCKEVNNEAFDIYPFMTRCTLDIICETAMGQGVKAQLNADSAYVNAVYNLSQVLKARMMKPWLSPDFLFRLTSYSKLEQRSLQIIHGFTNKIIKMKRMQLKENTNSHKEDEDDFGRKRRVALLDLLLENSGDANSSEQSLTDNDIREEVDTFMFEGHDTTSVGIGWTLYCIGAHPDVQQKILDELNQVFGDSNSETTSDDLHKLKYLECVIKEAMRIFPPVPSFGRLIREELDICGYKIPANVNIIVATYYVHRDPLYYPDPDKFDPERFFPENSQNRDPFAYVPFSAGLRNCIGQKFAVMELKVILSRVLRNFKLTTVVDEDWMSNVISELVLRPIRGIWLKLEPREHL